MLRPLATHEGTAPDPESPGLHRPLLRVVDADARPGSNGRGRNPPLVLLYPGSIAQEISPIQGPIEPQRDAELSRPVREVGIRLPMPAPAHQFDPFDGLKRAYQHGVGDVLD